MKTSNLFRIASFLILVLSFVSCEKYDDSNADLFKGNDQDNLFKSYVMSEPGSEICGDPLVFELIPRFVDPEFPIGNLTVSNDDEFLYVSFNVDLEGWKIFKIYLYIGQLENMPAYGDGTPNPSEFTIVTDHDPMVTDYTFAIPLDEVDDCFVIMAKCMAAQFDSSGNKIKEKRVWARGIPLSDEIDWAYYIDYCINECCSELFRTQTPGGWGTVAKGNNPGAYRDANFVEAFPEGLVVGDLENYSLTLTNSKAVEDLLPCGGIPGPLNTTYVNPIKLKNELIGQLIALTLSVKFDEIDPDFSESEYWLGNQVITDGFKFAGMSVNELLLEANIFIGGGFSNYSAGELNEILSLINESFIDGEKSSDLDLFLCP